MTFCNNLKGFLFCLGRFFLLLIGNICNWALAAYGLFHHDRDFATHLLAIFMGNTVLYTMFYINMKLIHKERVQLHVSAFLVLGFIAWFSSYYFFVNKSISWAVSSFVFLSIFIYNISVIAVNPSKITRI